MRTVFAFLLLTMPAIAEVKFRTQEIATDLTIGYAVLVADIDQDGKPDLVVVDQHRIVWYRNPTWEPRLILKGVTKPDNVCIAAHDIDGDGKIDLVLGAEWKPFNTKSGGTLHWLRRGKTLDEPWDIFPISEEPTVHRVKFAPVGELGSMCILLAPLMGRDSTKEANWTDGRPVRLLAFPIPHDPVKGPWKAVPIDEEHLHVMHNVHVIAPEKPAARAELLTASYEGVSRLTHDGTAWKYQLLNAGNQATPKASRGASEIKAGKLADGRKFIATIEPWHGNQVVVYIPKGDTYDRIVVDEALRWGHAVWCADLDGDGADELIIGVRDNPTKDDKFTEKRGVRIYRPSDATARQWERTIIEDGGVAVEDLAAADLDGDGKIDLIAVGRATKNARIYWNLGVK